MRVGQNRSTAVMARRHSAPKGLDFFPTPYWATRSLCMWLRDEHREWLGQQDVWEPAAGEMHMADVLAEYFRNVHASDVADYGHGYPTYDIRSALFPAPVPNGENVCWIVTNPPFHMAGQFIRRSLEYATNGAAFLLRSSFTESRGRYENLFGRNPPTEILQFVDRVSMVEGRLADPVGETSATAYAWFVWRMEHVGKRCSHFHWLPYKRKDWDYPPGENMREAGQ